MKPAGWRNHSGTPGDESDLVRAAQSNDSAAFGELVKRYQRAVFRIAYGLTRNTADADDLAQETFVRAYRAIGTFKLGEPMFPWLARIATNLCFSLFRHRRRRPETSIEPLVEAGHQWGVDDDPAEHAADRERRQQLGEVFDQLSPEHRAVLVLRVVEDLSYEEIARTVGVPIGTVMSRLSRARAELKTRFEARTGEKS